MNRIASCPACAAGDAEAWPALVAPFIAEFVLQSAVQACRLLECRACGMRFFDRGYTDAESERLYGRYRGPAYFEVRHRHEPWYTARYNDKLGGNGTVLEARKQRIAQFLSRHLSSASVASILDYGGDSGQVLPQGWGHERFVYDLSDAVAVPGVRKLSSASELASRTFELVLLSHVLEHASNPADMLLRARELLARQGTLFIEVPYERYNLQALGRGAFGEAYLAWLSRRPLWLRAVDFVSTAARVKLGWVPPLGFVKLHEHVNFFAERSLAALAARCGFDVLGIERQHFAPPVDTTAVLVALLRRRA